VVCARPRLAKTAIAAMECFILGNGTALTILYSTETRWKWVRVSGNTGSVSGPDFIDGCLLARCSSL
jgi:hypothetical protein